MLTKDQFMRKGRVGRGRRSNGQRKKWDKALANIVGSCEISIAQASFFGEKSWVFISLPPSSKDVSCSGKFVALVKALLCTWLWYWRNECLFSDLILLPREKGLRGIWVEDFLSMTCVKKLEHIQKWVTRRVIMSNIHEAVIYWIHVYPEEGKTLECF